MKILKEGQKYSKMLILLLLPAMFLIWMIGWCLYWFGHQKERQKTRLADAQEKDYGHLMPITLEEPLEARSE